MMTAMAAIRFIDRRAAPSVAPPPASPEPVVPFPGPSPAPAPEADRDARLEGATPMMAQYLGIKAEHPDALLFYRMGDFYELFLADAVVAASVLGIVLTKRGRHNGEDIAMCGVPVERSDDYLHTLIARGHTVAVCEQTEDPAEARRRGGKSVVNRAVVRIVTPGTITEERLLEPHRANLLVALSRVRLDEGAWLYGVAAVDISTGSFTVAEVPESGLGALLARLEPREVVVADAAADEPALRAILEDAPGAVSRVARDVADPASAERILRDWYGVETLDGFGAFTRAETAAAAAAVAYIARTQLAARPALQPPARAERGLTVEIDPSTRANLEMTRTLGGERSGSLLHAVDTTVTPAGSRLLAERLAGPLTDPARIAARLDAVGFAVADRRRRLEIRRDLKRMPDMARALSRLSLGRGGPRDLAALRDGLAVAYRLSSRLLEESDLPAELAAAAATAAQIDAALGTALGAALADDLPLSRRDGGFIRTGHDLALDEARELRDDTRKIVAGLQARYVEVTEVRTLKVKHNNFLGFFIEVAAAVGETWRVPPHNALFIHRQTMAGAMRFSTAELADLESRIASAADRALAIERDLFDGLLAAVMAEASAIRAAADALAAIDVASALGEVADTRQWVRPAVDGSLAFRIEAGRHPVVEAALKAKGVSFVANACDLSGTEGPARARAKGGGGRIAVVTGPNMAGKSTFLRQNALIALLAQCGSYVPAAEAHIGVVDRLFSRVGAADDLARGRSTFMVEMVETAAILNQATDRSLVILDEIGRGTATFDGLSIAWAAVEHLHDRNRARGLFATHFHELTQLTKKLPRLVNLTMRVTDWNGDVVFLHEVVAGAADRSYGIQVAKLAGMPASAVARARTILAELEKGSRSSPVERMLDDLPLFARLDAPPRAPPPRDRLREALDAVDPDDLTPKAALEALYALKRAAKEEA
jgi:DNA mismatch repair protein MutS